MMFSPLSAVIMLTLGSSRAREQDKSIDIYKGQCGENHEFYIYRGNVSAVITATDENASGVLWEVECEMGQKFSTKCETNSGDPPLKTVSSFHFNKDNFYFEHALESNSTRIGCSIIRKTEDTNISEVFTTDLSRVTSDNKWIVQTEEANELLRENETLKIKCPDHFILKSDFGISKFINHIVTKVEMKKNGSTILDCENVFYSHLKDDEVKVNCTKNIENIKVETYKVYKDGYFKMIDLNFAVVASGETNSIVGNYECTSKVTSGSRTPMCEFQMEHGWLKRRCENVTLINKLQAERSVGVMEMEVKMENLTSNSRLGNEAGLDVLIRTKHEIKCSINSRGKEYGELSRISIGKLSKTSIIVRCCTKTTPIRCLNSTNFEKKDVNCKESIIGNLREHQRFNNQVLFTLRCIGESYNIAGFATPLPIKNWDLIIPLWECGVVMAILVVFIVIHFSGQFLHNIATRDQESSLVVEQPSIEIVEY